MFSFTLLDALVPGDDLPARLDELLKELEPLVAHRRDEDEAGIYWGYRLALDYFREPVLDLVKYNDALDGAHLHFEVKENAHLLAMEVANRLGFRG